MTTQKSLLLTETQDAMHKWLSLITGIILFFFCFINLVMLKQNTIGIIQALFGLMNLYLFRTAQHNDIQSWHRVCLISSLSIIAVYSFYRADLRAGSIYWLLVLPPLYCLLVGAKRGLLYTITLSIPVLLILFSKSDQDNYIAYRSVLNFVLAYFLSYGMCFLYEYQFQKSRFQLETMAFQDPLTGAKNRHALKLFFDQFNNQAIDPFMENELEDTRLLIIDIDHFKKVNDAFGHDSGDYVLVEMTELLQMFINCDHIYRIGGEEFLITLKNHSKEQAFSVAEMIRKEVEKTVFKTHSHSINITVSIGIAPLKQGQSFREFLRNADKNLYSAKNKGRNLVHYEAISVSEAI